MISFLLNDKLVQITDLKPDTTLLVYLREQQKLTGTKEGCASGDCGACTVVVAELVQSNDMTTHSDKLHYRSINSCVTFLSALQGKQLITVEHLTDKGILHPVQQSLVDHHASQCGFCTPGFVMSMFALYHQGSSSNSPINREQVNVALSGNLCRCTGYRPIIDATLAVCDNPQPDQFSEKTRYTIEQLQRLADNNEQGIEGLHIPSTRQQLAALKARYPHANMFAGSTDLALEHTQKQTQFSQLISLAKIPELHCLEQSNEGLKIGAALPFNELEAALLHAFPELSELISRFASTPIRNQASLGGNIATASPIGDMPPVLLALDAQLHLDNGHTRRILPIREFFTDYRQTKLQDNEWIEAVFIPARVSDHTLRAYKVSKRIEDDISAVCAVFSLHLAQGIVVRLSTGFGGVAAVPAMAKEFSEVITGKVWQERATMELGCELLSTAFSPLTDVRASAGYRQTIIINLWKRFWLETTQQANRVETRLCSHSDADLTKEASDA